MGITEVLSAPRSLWQRAYVERVIGTIRRECLDHVNVLNEASLYRHVGTAGTAARAPRALGAVVAIPQVGGLHHRYERRAA
jgi:hypothetical protein